MPGERAAFNVKGSGARPVRHTPRTQMLLYFAYRPTPAVLGRWSRNGCLSIIVPCAFLVVPASFSSFLPFPLPTPSSEKVEWDDLNPNFRNLSPLLQLKNNTPPNTCMHACMFVGV